MSVHYWRSAAEMARFWGGVPEISELWERLADLEAAGAMDAAEALEGSEFETVNDVLVEIDDRREEVKELKDALALVSLYTSPAVTACIDKYLAEPGVYDLGRLIDAADQ